MSIHFDRSLSGPLDRINGVTALDTVTARIAADALSERGLTVHAPAEIDLPSPPHLAQMATISFVPEDAAIPDYFSVTIDTGVLQWMFPPSDTDFEFKDYTGEPKKFFSVKDTSVTELPLARVIRKCMLTPNEEKVLLWAAEIDPTLDLSDRVTLLNFVQDAISQWEKQHDLGTVVYADEVYLPAAQIQYETTFPGFNIEEPNILSAVQKFAFAVSKEGARAIVAFAMSTGLPIEEEERDPIVYKFGTRGPVLYWFTGEDLEEPGGHTPFCIVHLTSEAFASPGQEIDLENLELPEA